jgi:guanylate kinase
LGAGELVAAAGDRLGRRLDGGLVALSDRIPRIQHDRSVRGGRGCPRGCPLEPLGAGEFLEHVEFPWGQRSGTLRSEIARISGKGKIPLLDLEPQGALDVKNTVPGAVTIFVEAPSFEENERRLRARATESEGEIEDRLELARKQLSQANEFDYLVVNDDLDRALSELTAIVRESLEAVSS